MINKTYAYDGLIGFEFNETIILDPDWSQSDWNITVTGPMNPYSFNWTFISEFILEIPLKNISMWFSYDSPDQYHGNGTEQIFFNFTKNVRVLSYSYEFEMLNTTVEFDLPPREGTYKCYVDKIQLASVLLGMLVLMLGFGAALGGYTMAIGWNMLHFLQILNYMPMLKIYMPS